MATKLRKAIHREMLSGKILAQGKHRGRNIIVSLLPGDEIQFRYSGTQQKVSCSLGHVIRLATLLTIDREFKEKLKEYAQRKKFGRARRPKRPALHAFSKIYLDAAKTSA